MVAGFTVGLMGMGVRWTRSALCSWLLSARGLLTRLQRTSTGCVLAPARRKGMLLGAPLMMYSLLKNSALSALKMGPHYTMTLLQTVASKGLDQVGVEPPAHVYVCLKRGQPVSQPRVRRPSSQVALLLGRGWRQPCSPPPPRAGESPPP
jgi:hypothetical protein